MLTCLKSVFHFSAPSTSIGELCMNTERIRCTYHCINASQCTDEIDGYRDATTAYPVGYAFLKGTMTLL